MNDNEIPKNDIICYHLDRYLVILLPVINSQVSKGQVRLREIG